REAYPLLPTRRSSDLGAAVISPDEEINRALPVIHELVKRYPDLILSIDTFRANVAKACVQAGVHLINDISGGSLDEDMFATVARSEEHTSELQSRENL